MLKYILLILLSISGGFAAAEKSINLHVVFGGSTDKGNSEYDGDNANYFINPELKNAPMTCLGKNKAYYVDSSREVSNGTALDIKIKGIFDGDSRKECKLKNDDTYFIINNLRVSFYYRGKYAECLIDQSIGTSYDSLGNYYDKLQGNEKNTHLSCGYGSEFKYRLVPGHRGASYSPGYIQIYKDHPQQKQRVVVSIYSTEKDITDYRFTSVSMKCSGKGYVINSSNYNNEGVIAVDGPFKEDPRKICKLPDDNVYFALTDASIEFKYKGETKVCYLGGAQFGTSYDSAGTHYNKLQSYIPGNPFGSKKLKETPAQCIGLPGFFYKIIQGTTIGGYKSGQIKLMRASHPREYEDAITWILYINGIMNSADEAMNSMLEMERVAPSSNLGNLQYGLLYNRSNGFISDFADLERMKKFDSNIANEKYIDTYYDSTKDPKPKPMNDEYRKKALDWYLSMAYTEKGFDGLKPQQIFGSDLDSIWTSFMNYGIYPDKDKVIFVAHSQGNLYANVVYNYLRLTKGYKEENLSIIHLGTVSSNTNQNMPYGLSTIFSSQNNLPNYILGMDDHMVNIFRALHDDLLRANMSWKSSAMTKGEDRVNPKRTDTMNHGFVEAYLNHQSLLAGFTNLLYKFILTDEVLLNKKRDLGSNIAIYAIRDQPDSYNGYGKHILDPYYGAYYTKKYASIKSEIYNPAGKNLLTSNEVQTFFSEPSNSIYGVYLNSVANGDYTFNTQPGISYIVEVNQTDKTSQICGQAIYVLYINPNNPKVVCANGSDRALTINQNKTKWNFVTGSQN